MLKHHVASIFPWPLLQLRLDSMMVPFCFILPSASPGDLRSHDIFFIVFNFEGVSLIAPFLFYEKYQSYWSNCMSNARKRGLMESEMKILIIAYCAHIYAADEVK